MFFILKADAYKNNCIEFIKSLASGDGLCVEIKPYKKNRSVRQNSTMWMWYHVISKHTGIEPEDLHDQLKDRILGWEIKNINGVDREVLKSTTKLDTKEMARFLSAIEALAMELKIVLPMPQDYGYVMRGKDE